MCFVQSPSLHPCLSAPVGGQMFTGDLLIEKHGQIFTRGGGAEIM